MHVGQSQDNYDELVENLCKKGIDLSKLRYFWAGSTLPDTVRLSSDKLNNAIASVMHSGRRSGQKFCLTNNNIACSPVFSRNYGDFFDGIDKCNPNEIIEKIKSYRYVYQYNLESGYRLFNDFESLRGLNLSELIKRMQFLETSNKIIINHKKFGMGFNKNSGAIEAAYFYVRRMTNGAAQILDILSLASVALLVEGDPMYHAAMIMPYLNINPLNDNTQRVHGQPLVFHVGQVMKAISR